MSSSTEGFKCSICLEYYSGSSIKDYFVSTPGGHVFHFWCIRKHMEAGNPCCPICREHISLTNITRLYGIDPTRPKSRVKNSTNNNILAAQPTKKPDYVFKIVLLGSSSVGKSSLLQRFTTGVFSGDVVATTGCDVVFRMMEMGGKQIKLTIWDTVGQEKYRSVATNCVRNAHGVMLVYDVTDHSSFQQIQSWLEFVNDSGHPHAVKILIGNKVDVPEEFRMVTQRFGKNLASELGLSFFETSAKESSNVEAAFRCLVGEIMESTVLNPESENYDARQDDNPIASPTGSGCLQLPRLTPYYDPTHYRHNFPHGEPSCIC